MHKAIANSFRKLASEGKNPNFIFVGGSYYQLASLAAFTQEKQREGINMCGVICDWVAPPHRRQIHDDSVFFIKRDAFIRLERDRDFSLAWSPLNELKEDLEQVFRSIFRAPFSSNKFTANTPLYLFYPAGYEPDTALWNTVLSLSDHICLVRYDEGLGTYVGQDAKEQLTSEPQQKRTIYQILTNVYHRIVSANIKKFRDKYVQEQNYLLFSKTSTYCKLNQKRSILYRDAFYQFAASQNIESSSHENAVIIVGFDFAKMHNTVAHELAMYQKILDILEKYSVKVIFRPHPGQEHKYVDQYRQLNINTFDQSETALESTLALSTQKPLAIIGLGSTAQATANAFWSIPCLSIAKLLEFELAKDGEIPDVLKLAFKEHELVSTLFADYMSTPHTYDELSKQLEDIFATR